MSEIGGLAGASRPQVPQFRILLPFHRKNGLGGDSLYQPRHAPTADVHLLGLLGHTPGMAVPHLGQVPCASGGSSG